EAVSEGVLTTGSVTGQLAAQCGRCLIEFTEPLDVPFLELFGYPDSTTAQTTESDEVPRLVGDHLDLEPVVRDAVVLSLPLTPLCRPDCAGLCPDCGERLEELPADHAHHQQDPRWAALAERFGSDSQSS
ncbi:MAG TPA: YceD family protein, partial [Jatrophihabitans sp.]|nr:YceD family protein [Jatrophihabitans sp.]